MRNLLIIALAASLAGPAFAADMTMDTQLGTTMEEVKASLADMGYEVRKAEMEDGKIEAYVVKDGTMSEIYVSTQTGKVTKIETK